MSMLTSPTKAAATLREMNAPDAPTDVLVYARRREGVTLTAHRAVLLGLLAERARLRNVEADLTGATCQLEQLSDCGDAEFTDEVWVARAEITA